MRVQNAIKAYKDDYIVFSKNKDVNLLLNLHDFNVISIDPASKNFAIRCESRSPRLVTTLRMTKEKFRDDIGLYDQITTFLDSFDFTSCTVCLIERQMVVNYTMIRASQHCLTYFCVKYPYMMVVEVSSKLKTSVLGAPPKLNYNERKKWSVEKAQELYRKYDDKQGQELFKAVVGKKDDVADTTTQSEAFFTLIGYVQK